MTTRVLLLLDAATLAAQRAGEPPAAPYSHDQTLFQFGHESLRRGWRVAAASSQGEPAGRRAIELAGLYPAWQSGASAPAPEWDPDIVVAVHPEALNLRRHHPRAKLVAIHAAVHWVESPATFGAQHVFDLITAARYNIDVVLTQNARMAELIGVFYALLARWPYPERILVAPLGIVAEARSAPADRRAARAAMGLGVDEIAIINAGGAWRWTDLATFLEAFAAHCEGTPATPLRLFQMGLLQPGNTDHGDFIATIEALLYRHRDLLGRTLLVQNDWGEASRCVRAWTAAADVGLNVNRDSLEGWQSQRLRALDYLAAGLPVIQTRGDLLAEAEGGAHAFLVRPGDAADQRRVLDAIAADPALLGRRAEASRALAARFDSRATYGAALEQIERLPRRADDDHAAWGDCVLDYAAAHVRAEVAARLRDSLARFGERLMEGA